MSNENTSFNKSSNGDVVDKEVRHLVKKYADKPKATYNILEELKNKYKDDEVVDAVMRALNVKMNKIKKIAEKIKDRLVAKYPNMSVKEYIDKVGDYKKKYGFDDSEMQAIINLLFLSKNTFSNPDAYDVNYNEMSKALGFVPASYNMSGKLNVKKEETSQLDAILSISNLTRELHDQVTLQSLIYADCDQMALQSTFDKTKINVFSYVHPVVAALFIPKFELLDQHMIMASIAKIVASKYNGVELQTQPEYELYWDIATDPSETSCVSKTKPFTDLLNRCNVQTKLWEAVLNLRQGKYYTNDLNSFILAIDNCKANIFDAADFAYVKDEGTIMRKLLAAFSIRPTIVLTQPVYSMSNVNSHIAPTTTSHITTLPMVTMRIPMTMGGKNTESISLSSALTQEQLYIHHKQITIKKQELLYSRELLIFYVHRRYHAFNTGRLVAPYGISHLPITMNQFEKLQDTDVDIEIDNLSIGSGNQSFSLKSVVCVETRDIKGIKDCNVENTNKLIYSCSSFIRAIDDDGVSTFHYYNPLNFDKSDVNGGTITAMSLFDSNNSMPKIRKSGTLFIYHTKKAAMQNTLSGLGVGF
jgi:hypothetical protein